MRFTALTIITVSSLFVAATPTSVWWFNILSLCVIYNLLFFFSLRKLVADLITIEQFKDWLDNTDAEITYVGEPIGDFSKRNVLNTMVTYCSSRVDAVCGGRCTVYNGGPTCLNAPATVCLAANHNVGFCNRSGCRGSCNQLSSCGVRLDKNFCYTPGTASILVGNE